MARTPDSIRLVAALLLVHADLDGDLFVVAVDVVEPLRVARRADELDIGALGRHLLDEVGILGGLLEHGGPVVDHLLGRPLGRHDPAVQREHHVDALLLEGREVGNLVAALVVGDAEGLELARLDVLAARGDIDGAELNGLGKQRGHALARAIIGHVLELHTRLILEQQPHELARRAEGGAGKQRARRGLGRLQEVVHVVPRLLAVGADDVGRRRQERHIVECRNREVDAAVEIAGDRALTS